MKDDSSHRAPLKRLQGTLPEGIPLPTVSRPLLAYGAETGNTFTLTDGVKAYISPDIGDLRDPSTCDIYLHSISEMKASLGVDPEIAVHDLHPDYISTRYAARSGANKLVAVQHHHAHAAACMHENGLSEHVLAVTYDGMGLGDDGTIWGGEFLICNLAHYERKAHLKAYPLPGGDQGTLYPERMAFSCLVSEPQLGQEAAGHLLAGLSDQETEFISRILEKHIQSPLTSSAGRLFDAVAAMLGFQGKISSPAEAAIGLQKAATPGVAGVYSYAIEDWQLGFGSMFAEILSDKQAHVDNGAIAAKFHNTLAAGTVDMCDKIREDTGLDKVALSGGVFHNTLLAGLIMKGLQDKTFNVFEHSLLPPGDVCVSFGQAIIASVKETSCA
jgi:hydrogenase maturation protein HypF